MRILNGVLGILLLGASGAALADEPVRLDAASMDSVVAGFWNGGGVAFTFGGSTFGQSNNFIELSQAGSKLETKQTPTTLQGNFQAYGVAQLQAQSLGIGSTATSGGGGVYTTVFQ